eukprot:COSAG02_NODE_5235_length_4517_cov_3.028067_5_plen_135_part_00
MSPVLQAPALPDMHASARVINQQVPLESRIGQEQATNLITSVFQTLRVSGQAIGPLLGAPALASVGFRGVMTFTGIQFLLAGALTALCYFPRIKDDHQESDANERQAYSKLDGNAENEEEGDGEQESLLHSDNQ